MSSEGHIKWFSNVKGYGFIERENKSDVFVHYTSIQAEGYRKLSEGDKVEFETTDGDRGPLAVNVVKLGSPVNSNSQVPAISN